MGVKSEEAKVKSESGGPVLSGDETREVRFGTAPEVRLLPG